ncbi:hypothetical protein J1614_007657 [Plenodomus biglobosus]|nr:hypothetical protein J1614_007657 [Plenodomus biglobosus]
MIDTLNTVATRHAILRFTGVAGGHEKELSRGELTPVLEAIDESPRRPGRSSAPAGSRHLQLAERIVKLYSEVPAAVPHS